MIVEVLSQSKVQFVERHWLNKPSGDLLIACNTDIAVLYPVLTTTSPRSENIIAKTERVDTGSHSLEKPQTVATPTA